MTNVEKGLICKPILQTALDLSEDLVSAGAEKKTPNLLQIGKNGLN